MSDSRVFQNRFTSLWWLHVCLQMLVSCVFSMSDSRGVSESLYFSVMTACMFADACFVCIFHEWLSGCFRIALLLCDDCMYVCRCLFRVYFPWVTLGVFQNRFTSLWWLHVCLQLLVSCVFSMSDSRVFQNRFTSLWWLHVCLQMLVSCVFSMSDSRGVSESLYFSVMTACVFAAACFVCIFHEWLSGCFRIALLLCDDCMCVCRCLFRVYFPWVTLGCFRIALLLCDDCMCVCRCLFRVYFPWVTLGVFQNRFTSLWWLHVCLQMLVSCVFSISDSRGVSESIYFSVMTACVFADACFVPRSFQEQQRGLWMDVFRRTISPGSALTGLTYPWK